jgi:hypothetical protein
MIKDIGALLRYYLKKETKESKVIFYTGFRMILQGLYTKLGNGGQMVTQ